MPFLLVCPYFTLKNGFNGLVSSLVVFSFLLISDTLAFSTDLQVALGKQAEDAITVPTTDK